MELQCRPAIQLFTTKMPELIVAQPMLQVSRTWNQVWLVQAENWWLGL